jgi:CarD family transcriptional regulator
MMKFDVGQKVFYPGHGPGVITNADPKEIFGKIQKFLTVHITHSNMKIMLPLSNAKAVGLRKVKS